MKALLVLLPALLLSTISQAAPRSGSYKGTNSSAWFFRECRMGIYSDNGATTAISVTDDFSVYNMYLYYPNVKTAQADGQFTASDTMRFLGAMADGKHVFDNAKGQDYAATISVKTDAKGVATEFSLSSVDTQTGSTDLQFTCKNLKSVD